MPRKILVTGGTGLIGRQVIRHLVERGNSVVGFDRRLESRMQFIPQAVASEVMWIEGDTRDSDALEGAMRSVDAIVHLAAGASFLMYEEAPVEQTAGTIQGFHTVLEAARHAEIGSLVYASTSAVYEGNEVPYKEAMTIDPPDLKSFSKKVNEEMASIYSRRYGMRLVGLRPFSVYGDDEMHKEKYANIISLFVWAMLGGKRPLVWADGSQTRDFIHADDVARAFALAGESDVEEPFLNVGTGIETSFLDVIDIIASRLGIEANPVFVDVPVAIYARRLLADTSLTKSVLDFSAEITLGQGIDRVIERVRHAIEMGVATGLDEAQEVVFRDLGAP